MTSGIQTSVGIVSGNRQRAFGKLTKSMRATCRTIADHHRHHIRVPPDFSATYTHTPAFARKRKLSAYVLTTNTKCIKSYAKPCGQNIAILAQTESNRRLFVSFVPQSNSRKHLWAMHKSAAQKKNCSRFVLCSVAHSQR